MNGIVDEATVAAVDYILDHLHALPADQGRVAWFFFDVLTAYAAIVTEEQRRRLSKPSQN